MKINSESVRERIRQTISESKGNLDFSPALEHIITQICFEMYKAGFNDNIRLMKTTLKEYELTFKR